MCVNFTIDITSPVVILNMDIESCGDFIELFNLSIPLGVNLTFGVKN